jgi:hypothetical protein
MDGRSGGLDDFADVGETLGTSAGFAIRQKIFGGASPPSGNDFTGVGAIGDG